MILSRQDLISKCKPESLDSLRNTPSEELFDRSEPLGPGPPESFISHELPWEGELLEFLGGAGGVTMHGTRPPVGG